MEWDCLMSSVFVVLDLLDLRELLKEALEKKYPDTPLLQALMNSVEEAEKCANVASQLVSAKVRTRFECRHVLSTIEPVALLDASLDTAHGVTLG